ncbi:hypothetical protein IAT38_005088 [Cryptococcus sp. DSM 104549]
MPWCPPYVSGARVTFAHLPEDIIRPIANLTDDPYAFMRVCHQTLYAGGQALYRRVRKTGHRLRPSDFPVYRSHLPPACSLHGLLLGLEHDEPTQEAPFGRELKLRFLGAITKLEIRLAAKGMRLETPWCWKEKYKPVEWERYHTSREQLVHLTQTVHRLAAANICIFPNVAILSLFFGYPRDAKRKLSKPTDDPTVSLLQEFTTTFVGLTRPRRFTLNLGGIRTELACNPEEYRYLRFFGGHVPDIVCHELTLQATSPSMNVPIVCHGTVNVVSYVDREYADLSSDRQAAAESVAESYTELLRWIYRDWERERVTLGKRACRRVGLWKEGEVEKAPDLEARTRWVFVGCYGSYGGEGDWDDPETFVYREFAEDNRR